MSTTYVVATIAAAALAAFSAAAIHFKFEFVVGPLADYGVPRSWWPWLAAAKATGAIGLIAGLFVPWVGAAAAIGLVLYFTGALITVLRARSWAHIPAPLLYLAPAAASLALI
ncbi:DoxX family protein [Amycolatopsis lurida]